MDTSNGERLDGHLESQFDNALTEVLAGHHSVGALGITVD